MSDCSIRLLQSYAIFSKQMSAIFQPVMLSQQLLKEMGLSKYAGSCDTWAADMSSKMRGRSRERDRHTE